MSGKILQRTAALLMLVMGPPPGSASGVAGELGQQGNWDSRVRQGGLCMQIFRTTRHREKMEKNINGLVVLN